MHHNAGCGNYAGLQKPRSATFTDIPHCARSGHPPSLQVAASNAWVLDVDKSVLDAVPTQNTFLLPPKDDSTAALAEGRLLPNELQHIVGRAASDAGGRGNINAGTDGAVTFVLAPGAAAPGGPGTVLQIVQALRAAGHFTVAAVTRPFAFEGDAKQDQVCGCILGHGCLHSLCICR